MVAALKEAQKLLESLQAAYNKKNYDEAARVLGQLKLKLIQLPALPPSSEATPTAKEELTVARGALEHAVLVALRRRDEAALERAFVQLKAFYADTRAALGPSPSEAPMLGLNMLRLLAGNRVAEFHTELERVPPEALNDPYVARALRLERWLTEGAYNKVLAEHGGGRGGADADDLAAAYLDRLAATVRDEVAGCAEAAYGSLTLADAQRLMLFGSAKEAAAYAAQRGWQVKGDLVTFARGGGGNAAAAAAAGGGAMDVDGSGGAAAAGGGGGGEDGPIPGSMALIRNALMYAKELERIV